MHTDDEIQPEEADRNETYIASLETLGISLRAKLRDAIAARTASGIEQKWAECEESYQGYDDANRNEFTGKPSKPRSDGGTSEVPKRSRGSTVFPNITQPYVDAAAARIGDTLFSGDDRNFAIEPTPIPDMGMNGGMHQMPNGSMMPNEQMGSSGIEEMRAVASRAAEKAQDRIDDWLTECQYNSELRKLIDDCAKLGTGIMRGPVPMKRKVKKWQTVENGISSLTIIEETKPGSYRVDPWNFFPSADCGDNIQQGSGVWERDVFSIRKLHELRGAPGYIKSQIDKVITEGPQKDREFGNYPFDNSVAKQELFTIWYYTGTILAEDLRAIGCACDDNNYMAQATIGLINGHVIRAAISPIDSGDFPYDVIPWKRRAGMPWGIGVAEQLRTPQRIVTAATRNLMDNAGLAAGPQFVLRRGIEPENGVLEIVPLKFWVEGEDSNGQSGPPFLAIEIPMLQDKLLAIIQFGMKLAEDVTGLPMLLQGQQGKAPDTVGGMTILNNNANAVLRRVARLFDSNITEPHVRRYYLWLMEHSEDESEKGDFQIVARGSTALVERDIQSQEMINILQLCSNPIYDKSPKQAMNEYLKSRKFDPAAFDYTDDERQEMQQRQPVEDPRITAAKITADSTMKRRAAELQVEQEENAQDRQLELLKEQINQHIETMKMSGEKEISFADLKAMLASTSMKLNVQQDLALAADVKDFHKHYNPAPQVVTPLVEPLGRAAPGRAFQA